MRRSLGQTGIQLSPIGFGAFKIGRNQGIKYPTVYDLPDDAATEHLLNGVLDLGINLIDTAPAYGRSEERIGRFLSRRRKDFILSTKVGETFENGQSTYDYSAASIRDSVHGSLKRLRTDVLDLVFVHSRGDDEAILTQTDVVPTLQSLRDAGLIRFLGMSGKTPAGARLAMDWASVLMVEYHLNDTSHEPIMAEALHRGIGVVVKKGLASGQLPPATAIPFVLNNPAVASLIIGGLNLEHLKDNLHLATTR